MELTKEKILLKNKILVLYIDGNWDTTDFEDYFQIISSLDAYYRAKNSDLSKSRGSYVGTQTGVKIIPNPISVKSIKYGSAGVIELLLSASVITAIVTLVKHYLPNGKELEERKKIAVETMGLEIENLKKLGFTESEIQDEFLPKLMQNFGEMEKIAIMTENKMIKKIEERDLDEGEKQ